MVWKFLLYLYNKFILLWSFNIHDHKVIIYFLKKKKYNKLYGPIIFGQCCTLKRVNSVFVYGSLLAVLHFFKRWNSSLKIINFVSNILWLKFIWIFFYDFIVKLFCPIYYITIMKSYIWTICNIIITDN